jgi:hypothetical protein
VRLDLGGEGLAIRRRGPFSLFIDWEARYSEITRARVIRGPGVAGPYLDGPGGAAAGRLSANGTSSGSACRLAGIYGPAPDRRWRGAEAGRPTRCAASGRLG